MQMGNRTSWSASARFSTELFFWYTIFWRRAVALRKSRLEMSSLWKISELIWIYEFLFLQKFLYCLHKGNGNSRNKTRCQICKSILIYEKRLNILHGLAYNTNYNARLIICFCTSKIKKIVKRKNFVDFNKKLFL